MPYLFAPLARSLRLPPVEERRQMPGRIEFVAMMALLMGIMAMGIDLMLPGMDMIAEDLGQESSADVAPIVTAYFFGLAVGQLLWGPMADHFGRKVSLNVGVSVIVVAALAAAAAPSLAVLMVVRFVWGFGASAARSTTMTVVRDRFRGDRMASVMSLIFSVFILVPVVAPTIGAAGLAVTSWRGLFVGIAVFAVVLLVWLRRLPETLDPADVRSVKPSDVWASARVVFQHRVTMGYLWALTSLSAAFTAWIALAEPVINVIYGLDHIFPLVFGALALSMAIASLANSTVVQRVGARRLVRFVMVSNVVLTSVWLVATIAHDGIPPLWMMFGAVSLILMSQAFLQSNAQSLAMDPMGEVAGLASAVIGAISLGVGTVLGALVQMLFDSTVTPIAGAWVLATVAALGFSRWADRAATTETAANARATAKV